MSDRGEQPVHEVRGERSGPWADGSGELELMDLRLHAPRPDVVIVRVSGPVEGRAARLLADRVGKQLRRAPHVVLDLGGVTVLGRRVSALLFMLYQQALARGSELHFVGVEHDAVRRPLHATDLAPLLNLESTAEAVIAALPRPVPHPDTGRVGPAPGDEGPAAGVGQDHAGTVGLAPGHCARLRCVHVITPDPPARQVNGREAAVPRPAQTPHDHTGRGMTGCFQHWQDAEQAMNVARRCFEEWLRASQQDKDTPSTANRHAYHTHEALHETAHAITLLIETFRGEAMTLAGSPVIASGD